MNQNPMTLSPTQVMSRRTYGLLSLAILCFGILLRLIGVNKDIWLDEYFTIKIIFSNSLFHALRLYDYQPPLYYLLLKAWSQLGSSEPLLRIPSILLGIGTLIITMKWLRPYSKLGSLLAGLICAALPVVLLYSQEIRNYPLLVFFTALAFLFASRVVAEPDRLSGYAGLCVSLCLAVATHLIGAMVVASAAVFMAALFLSRSNSHRLSQVRIGRLFASFLLPAVLFSCIYIFFIREIPTRSNWWMPELSKDLVVATFKYVLGYQALIFPLDWLFNHGSPFALPIDYLFKSALLAWFLGLIVWGDFRRSWPFLAAAACYWLVIAAYSALVTPIFDNRTLLPGLIPFMGFIALQSATISRKKIRTVIIAGWIAVTLVFALGWLETEARLPREKWRETADFLASHYRPGNLVIFYPAYIDGAVQYYFPTFRAQDAFQVDLGAPPKSVESEIHRRIPIMESQKTNPVLFLVVRSDYSVLKDKSTYDHLLSYLEKSAGKVAWLKNFDIISVSQYGIP